MLYNIQKHLNYNSKPFKSLEEIRRKAFIINPKESTINNRPTLKSN